MYLRPVPPRFYNLHNQCPTEVYLFRRVFTRTGPQIELEKSARAALLRLPQSSLWPGSLERRGAAPGHRAPRPLQVEAPGHRVAIQRPEC